EQAAIRWLAATTRIEHGAIEDDERRVTRLDVTDARRYLARVRVGVAELLADRRHGLVLRGLARGQRPGHVRVDRAQELVLAGRQRGDVVRPRLDAVEDLAIEHGRPARVLDLDVVRNPGV